MLSYAQPSHVSATVAMVSVPVVGLWIEICLPQYGFKFGLLGLAGDIIKCERATMASPFVLVWPQEPIKPQRSALLVIKEDRD